MFRNVRATRGAVLSLVTVTAALSGMLAAPAPAAPFAKRLSHEVAYVLHNVGQPPFAPPAIGFSQVVGFNNTGQFVGQIFGNPGYICVAFTGKAWVRLNDLATTGNCFPTSGISDADSAGVFTTVGQLNLATDSSAFAFYSTVSPTSAKTALFPQNTPSILYLENKSGLAAGYSYYAPVGGFSTSTPSVTSTGTSLSILQPSCKTVAAACMYEPYSNENGAPAGGGRFINASGTIFGQAINNTNGSYLEYTGGKSPTALQFNLPPDGTNTAEGVSGIDDNGDVAYDQYDTKLGETLTWIYNPKTKHATRLPTLPGFSCGIWGPLWINGPGRVLGATYCPGGDGPSFYWTWDSKHGTVKADYDTKIGIVPRILNDKGEIAVDFCGGVCGPHRWGYLEPPSSF